MNNFFESNNKRSCCGCKLCGNICFKNAISFEYDDEGFWYPFIDKEKCINCGRCRRICPLAQRSLDIITDRSQVYAAYSKSEEILRHSASGGMFTVLSDVFLEKNGYVFGHSYNSECAVECSMATNAFERNLQRGSKYVQSDMNGIFFDIKKATQTGKPVLFTGTPCQVEAVKNFLGHIPENFYSVDIICHGVPSPKIFSEYVAIEEEKTGKKIREVVFRGKEKGWTMPLREFCYTDGSHAAELLNADAFNNLFLGIDCILRPSCYECRYAGKERISDVSIADFWGIQNKHNDMFNENRGCSLVLVNTQKGKMLFDLVSDKLSFKQVPLADAQARNTPLNRPTRPYFERDRFFKDYRKKGLEYCLNYYMPKIKFSRVKRRIRRKFRKVFHLTYK